MIGFFMCIVLSVVGAIMLLVGIIKSIRLDHIKFFFDAIPHAMILFGLASVIKMQDDDSYDILSELKNLRSLIKNPESRETDK